MWSPHFFFWWWQTHNQGKLFLQSVNGFGISHLSSNRWFYQDECKDCGLRYTWRVAVQFPAQQHGFLSLCSPFVSKLSPNAFFLCVSVSSANAVSFMLQKACFLHWTSLCPKHIVHLIMHSEVCSLCLLFWSSAI